MPTMSTKQLIKFHRTVIQKLARHRVKVAEIGGEQDTPFEQAFSNLAHAYLKDKAPSLLDYEVGFQLVDRNQENTKAIGVFGFKVGNQWLYAPVFFLNGDLKGHELLYIKNQDLFVPMKENWLNYILNRKPHVLGTPVTKNMQQLGIMPPNLYQLSRSPYKYASVNTLPDWVQDALPVIAYAAVMNPKHDAKYASVPDLPTFLKAAGLDTFKYLLNSCKLFPKLAQAIDSFHGFNVVQDIISHYKKANEECCDKSVINPENCEKPLDNDFSNHRKPVVTVGKGKKKKKESLKIAVYKGDISIPAGDEFKDLSDKERTKLLQEGIHIRDGRHEKEISVAYDAQSELKLTNPTETGIYDLLVKPAQFEKCLVLFGPHWSGGRAKFVTVLRLDGAKNWLNIHSSHLWIKRQLPREEYEKWYKDQKDCDALPVKDGATYVLMGPYGQASLPFTVEKELSSSNGVKSYDVYFQRWAAKERPDHLRDRRHFDNFDNNDWSDGERVTLTGRVGGAMRTGRGDLYVPDGYKVIKVKEPYSCEEKDKDFKKRDYHSSAPMVGGQSKESPIQPGDLKDLELLIMSKTAALKIYHDGLELDVNGQRVSPLQGLIHLVRDYGLREKQAREMIKQAEQKKVARFRIKLADEYYDMQRSTPSAPYTNINLPEGYEAMTGGVYPTQSTLEQNIPVPSLSSSMTNRDIYRPTDNSNQPGPDQNTMGIAQQAAQTGQKEIFDVGVISSLLKATRDDSMVDKWLPDLMKGMDRIGRLLMIFYYHQEEFADRYGRSELPELEDSLRNTFENIGDLLLTLKQKTVESYPDDINKIDLDNVANS
jgi:hypothetical protein